MDGNLHAGPSLHSFIHSVVFHVQPHNKIIYIIEINFDNPPPPYIFPQIIYLTDTTARATHPAGPPPLATRSGLADQPTQVTPDRQPPVHQGRAADSS